MLAGVSSLAHAQPPARSGPPQSLSEILNLRRGTQAPTAARYVAGDIGFIFDRSTLTVRFDGARELIALDRKPAPKGETVYINDVGERVLKVSGLGGMTLFTPQRPQGVPVAFVSVTESLRLPSMGGALNYGRRLLFESTRASRVSQRLVVFTSLPPDLTPETDGIFLDAASLTADAFERAGRLDAQKSNARWRKITEVELAQGPSPAAMIIGDTLRIVVNPSRGVAGRPSSERILRALRSG